MSLTIEANPDKKMRVTIADADSEDTEGLPECTLLISGDHENSTEAAAVLLNPYQAEAVGNALLRWVSDVSIDADDETEDEDLEDEELDDEEPS